MPLQQFIEANYSKHFICLMLTNAINVKLNKEFKEYSKNNAWLLQELLFCKEKK